MLCIGYRSFNQHRGEPIACFRAQLCGNGNVDTGETCDDGNMDGDDGCSATCQTEDGSGDGGCCSAGTNPAGPLALSVLTLGLVLVRRRRRRA